MWITAGSLAELVDKGYCAVWPPPGMMEVSRRGSWPIRDHLNGRRGSFGTFAVSTDLRMSRIYDRTGPTFPV